MRRLLPAIVASLMFALPPVALRAQSSTQVSPDLQKAINAAISSGIAYLQRTQSRDASWQYRKPMMGVSRQWPGDNDFTGGLTALALYALSASGVPKTDDAIVRGLDWCQKHSRPFSDGTRATYSASLLVLALSSIDPVAHKKWIHELAQRIVESQLESGMWNYELRTKRSGSREPRGRAFGAWLQNGDNSNTQFALLALWAAQSLTKFKVPSSVWRRVKALYARTQNEDGGWSYKDPDSRPKRAQRPRRPMGGGAPLWMYKTSPAMTAAALVGYGYATAALKGGSKALPKVRTTKRVQAGVKALLADKMAWPERARDLYLMYGFERVGSVIGLPNESWYSSGAEELVGRQTRDGRWPGRGGRMGFGSRGDKKQVYETSLALLFLSKATSRTITPRRK